MSNAGEEVIVRTADPLMMDRQPADMPTVSRKKAWSWSCSILPAVEAASLEALGVPLEGVADVPAGGITEAAILKCACMQGSVLAMPN